MISDSGIDQPTLLIVGNGMVSYGLCSKLVQASAENGGEKSFKIIVVGDEDRPAYDRVHLTKFFDNRQADDLLLADRCWYHNNDIDLRLGQRVTDIDPDAKTVTTSAGDRLAYDHLVLATGSRPFVPPIGGVDQPGVFVYRTIEDLAAIDEHSKTTTSAAVMGGGLLGLEAAKALVDLNIKTHVVEMAPSLMPRQLDAEGAAVLQAEVEKIGIDVHLIKRTERIERRGDALVLHFDRGESVEVGMVVISAGIRPNDQLADCDGLRKGGGLERGPRGGFKVNDLLQTSLPDVYAIGECASHNETIYGLVSPGYQMADVLADNFMAGSGSAVFSGGDRSARLKLLGVDVATLGQPLGDVPNATTIASRTDTTYRKLILSKGRVVGVMAVGPWSEIERVRQAIVGRSRIWKWRLNRFSLTGDLWKPSPLQSTSQWPETAIVCSCMKVTRGTLSQAQTSGCCTVAALAEATGASTVCGSCRPLLADLVDDPAEVPSRPGVGLLVVSAIAIVALLAWLVGPLPYADTVVDAWHKIDVIWRDSFWKQVTGYVLLSVSVLALLLPLRKRWKRLAVGNYSLWRTVHGVIGIMTLVGLLVHTGLRLGSNFNLLLAVTFLGLNFTGAITGAITSWESRTGGELGMTFRQWRPRISKLHLYCLWPMPALLIIHIVCVYFY